MSKRKLLVFASTFPRWKKDTIPPFVYELSKRLVKGFDVTVLAPSFPGAKEEEVMDGMKVKRFHYGLGRYETLASNEGILPALKKSKWNYFKIPFFLLGEFFALRKEIKENRPDMIHAHWIIPQGFVAAICKKFYGTRFVVTTHGGDIFGLRGFVSRMSKRFTLRNADKITVVSNAIKKEILTTLNPKLKIDVVSMGVDSKKFNPRQRDDSIKKKYKIGEEFLLFVGRLAEKEGVKYLLEAEPDVLKKFPKAKLLIVGSGPLEKELKEIHKNLKLKDSVVFTGAIANAELPKYYATADIFVGPSIEARGGDKEGLGLTFVEAGMSGALVIATDLEAIADAIQDGKTGFIVKQKNSKEIAKKIISLLGSKDKMGKMQKTARAELVKKFDWDVVSKRYDEILGGVGR